MKHYVSVLFEKIWYEDKAVHITPVRLHHIHYDVRYCRNAMSHLSLVTIDRTGTQITNYPVSISQIDENTVQVCKYLTQADVD